MGMWSLRKALEWLVGPVAPVEDDQRERPAPALRARDVFTRFWPDARPFRIWLGIGLILVMVTPLLDAVTIWLFKLLIDDVLTVRRFPAFWPLAIAYLAITLIMGIVEFADGCLAAWIGENFLHRLRTRVFTHLQTLSIDFFDRRPLGDILSRLTGDVSAIEDLMLAGLTNTIAQTAKIVLFIGVLFYLNWQLALASLLAVPVYWLLTRSFSQRIKAASREVRQRSGSISAVAEESLGNATLIQVYGRQQAEIARFTEQSRGSVIAELAATRLRAVFSPLTGLLEVAGVMVIIGLGVWELTSNRITLGGLLVFLVYLSQLHGPLRDLGQLSNTIYAAAASAERIIDILEAEPEVRAPAHPVRVDRPRGELTVDRVSFRYPGATANTLSEISFVVSPGHSLALVGASGAGKTTLTKLLLRLHDPATGAIRLDGIDARNFDPDHPRA
ncbi:MAG TPA: ABC transporter ATP-binding protein, partial [Pseudonocardiaceae bacterium]|nr:ABC transporter ATP-binding protein [Pseudonocardiaceae bacterium]